MENIKELFGHEWTAENWADCWALFDPDYSPKDPGRIGKISERVLRQWFRRWAAVPSVVEKIAPQGDIDITVTRKVDGKTFRFPAEIKTACGDLGNYTRAKYVMYCPEVIPGSNLADVFSVFPVDDFTWLLHNYPGSGQFLRVNSQRGTLHIQSFRSAGRPGASRPIRVYLETVCAKHPIVRIWEAEISGRD